TTRLWRARRVHAASAILEDGPLARRVVDIAALHPIPQRIGREALVPQGRREAGVEVRVHVADLYNLVALRVHERDVRLVAGVIDALPHHVTIFVDDHAVGSPHLARTGQRLLGWMLVQVIEATPDLRAIDQAVRLPRRDAEHARDVVVAGVGRSHEDGRRAELGDRLARTIGRDVEPP